MVYGDDFEFTLVKAAVLREGTDVTLMSCGTVLERVLEAAARLVQDGVNPRVVSISTLETYRQRSYFGRSPGDGGYCDC